MSKFFDALEQVGHQEHPHVDHYQSGGMGHLEGDKSRSVVGFVPTRMMRQFREHGGDWHGSDSDETVDKIKNDIHSGEGIKNPLMLQYDHKRNWAYLGEGNHRLRAAYEAGAKTVPVRVIRSDLKEQKKNLIGDHLEMHTNFDAGPHNEDYVPSDIHPYHFMKDSDGEAYQHKTGARFIPTMRIFTHTCGLDHRLFDQSNNLKPEVRTYILSTLGRFWMNLYGPGWDDWSMVYFAGSEASEWTSETLEGNNDFDVLVGVDYDKFKKSHPEYNAWSNEDITLQFNTQFKNLNNPDTWITVEGVKYGPFDNTWYVNKDSYDIKDIKPYAAYNVSKNEWAVKPPHLPHWSLSDLPRATQRVLKACDSLAGDILKLPEPERTQQGAALFDNWHTDRSRAFGPNGQGWYDIANLREKWLDQHGLWAELVNCKHRFTEGLGAALPGWSNTPFGYTAANYNYRQKTLEPVHLSEDLHNAIKSFRQQHYDKFLTQKDTHGPCTSVSNAFVDHLHEQNIPARRVRLQDDPEGSYHDVVESQGHHIDWTARQFSDDEGSEGPGDDFRSKRIPVPVVYSKDRSTHPYGNYNTPRGYTAAASFFHASPHDFAEGDRILPGNQVNRTTFKHDQTGSISNRKVFMSRSQKDAEDWARIIGPASGANAVHVYRVQPEGRVRHHADESDASTAASAVVQRKVHTVKAPSKYDPLTIQWPHTAAVRWPEMTESSPTYKDNVKEPLTQDEKDTIHHYSRDGYWRINNVLRGTTKNAGFPTPEEKPRFHAAIHEHIAHLDSAMAKHTPLEGDPMLHRGSGHQFLRGLKTGDEYTDPAFTSTSRNRETASDLIGTKGTEMHIRLRGAHHLDVAHHSNHETEDEVLLGRGTRFKVTNRRVEKGGKVHLFMDAHAPNEENDGKQT